MTSTSVLNAMFGLSASETAVDGPPRATLDRPMLWDPKRFGKEQIHALVRQIFFQAGSKASRQVVFSGVDEKPNVRDICIRVGHALSAQTSGSVCIVDIDSPPLRVPGGFHSDPPPSVPTDDSLEFLRDSAFQLSRNLWLVSSKKFLRAETTLAASWLGSRLDELRLDFDYTLFHAPPVAHYSDALLLGHLCDGVVLVLCANSTRRITALKTKEKLASANARVLGTVLSDRKFPIPDGIYRRL